MLYFEQHTSTFFILIPDTFWDFDYYVYDKARFSLCITSSGNRPTHVGTVSGRPPRSHVIISGELRQFDKLFPVRTNRSPAFRTFDPVRVLQVTMALSGAIFTFIKVKLGRRIALASRLCYVSFRRMKKDDLVMYDRACGQFDINLLFSRAYFKCFNLFRVGDLS